MISVIISTYNRLNKIKKAVQSVLNQTYADFELIVVDDKSKDDTQAVVEAFKDHRIHYIRLKRNSGFDCKPKNTGILASKGDYIAFLDDDNQYRPDHLAVLFEAIEKDQTLDMVYGDRWLIDETGRIKRQLGISHDFDPLLLMSRNFIDTSDVLIKRKALFDVGGWDERYKKYVDWNLWIRMNKYGKKFKRVPIVITDYFLHEDMKSNRVKTKKDSQTAFVPDWDPYDLEIELPYLNTSVRTQPKVAIFTITYDRLDYTKKSFKSLKKTAGYPYTHFVIDNGSMDGTKEWITDEWMDKDYNNYFFFTGNVGISKASNKAIEEIKKRDFDIIVKWDNDCIGLTEGWLAKMVDIWKSNHMFVLSCYVQGLNDNPGGVPRVGYGTVKGELLGVTTHLGGICHFADAHAYDEFRWDENSFLHGVQDMEISQWLKFHNYSMGYLENYFVSHGPHGSKLQKEDYPEYFQRRVKEKQTRYEKT